MSISISCPQCQQGFQIEAEAGSTLFCPHCRASVTVPQSTVDSTSPTTLEYGVAVGSPK